MNADPTLPLAVGFILSLSIAFGAWRLGALTLDGAMAATVVGALVAGFGGWKSAALLLLFFVTSSGLTHRHAAGKPQPEHRRGRSAAQVCATGTVATVLALWGGLGSSPAIATAFAAAIAASTADTWATEIGLLSKTPPRLITTGQIVTPGRSGGVTWLGTVAGGIGAAVIAAAATWWQGTPFPVVWMAGSFAMVFDSVAGATIEGKYRGIDNNTVNLMMTTTGALLATLLTLR